MCGIAGIISPNSALIQQQKLQSMANALQHRGPDGQGFWINKNGTVGLAHRRLSIIDLSNAGSQPMHFNNRYSIVFNGEIYNYIELRSSLQSKGYRFNTSSDTEVILAAYDAYKDNCVQYFDGMFALAIWDEQEQKLFAARDRFGEKPFYYFIDGEQLVFASEMKALWSIGISKQINNTMLLNYITLGFVSNPVDAQETFYQHIQKLPAACTLCYLPANNQCSIKKYWDVDKETTITISEKEATQRFQQLFYQSVSRRLRSDVAVGTSLSGGLDSSSIVAAIHHLQESNYNYQSFSAVFPGYEKDETAHINNVAKQFSLKTNFVAPTAEGFVRDFDKLMYHQEEPFQSSSIYAQYKVYELAKQQNVTVLLDGQGADETLAGYHKYYHWYWQELLANKNFARNKKEIIAARNIGVAQPWGIKHHIAAFFPKTTARQLQKGLQQQQISYRYLSNDFYLQHFDTDTLYKPVVRNLNDILYFNTMQFGLEELLRYADRNSMAHSREIRLPFLNHELVQFIFSLPSSYKIRDGFTKWILRKTMEPSLPASIVWRTDKVGFEPPQQSWMLHATVQDKIHESKKKLVQQGILQAAVLQHRPVATTAHAGNNFDWRYLSAATIL